MEIESLSTKTVAVGELACTSASVDELKTYALGSCVAVIVFDPASRCVGMVHVALPDSSLNPGKAAQRTGYFADSGIPALLERMDECGNGARANCRVVKMCGGANVMDPNNVFEIGKRNIEAIRSILSKRGMRIVAEDLGGTVSRTVSVSAKTARVILSSPGRPDWKL